MLAISLPVKELEGSDEMALLKVIIPLLERVLNSCDVICHEEIPLFGTSGVSYESDVYHI